ncbi:MAG: heavy metal translocating P-type ATPase [Candidatus Heimdallarchaeota archaeon]
MSHLTRKYHLKGLDCAKCAAKIETSLKGLDVSQVKVEFSSGTLTIDSTDLNEINRIISRIEPGIKALPMPSGKRTQESNWLALIPIVIALVFLIIGLIFEQSLVDTPQQVGLYLVFLTAYFIVGWKVLWRALTSLKNRNFTNEHFLMAVATLGAILLQELPEAVAVMLFYTVGEYLQARAVNRSRQSISALLDIRPDEAHVIEHGQTKTIPAEEVQPGNKIFVKPGERVPLDGKVVKGTSVLDMSALTGESRPVPIQPDDDILSGSINAAGTKGSGTLHIHVTRPFQESTVSRILNAVESATEKKSKNELLITRFAKYYTPAVIMAAIAIAILPPLLLGASLKVWTYRALVVLVISCPCALVVSIPLTYFSGIGKNSHDGILLKGADVIDSLADTSVILWDKTGTLTEGEFKVIDVISAPSVSEEEVLRYAAIAETHSNHPIAISIRDAYGKEVDSSIIEEFEEFPALGIRARTATDEIMVGNDKFLHELDIAHGYCIDNCTAAYVIVNRTYVGHLLIDDQIKQNSFVAMDKLRSAGISRIGLLTGDTKATAENVAGELGISSDEIYTNLFPLNKIEILEKYLLEKNGKETVAFVGDGINDAPVIARADVGVAMGAIGSDATIEAADVVIMDDDPVKLATAIHNAKRTETIAKQNIVMALGIKMIFVVLGIFGLASMWAAVFGDVGVTILTIINSLRVLRGKN